MRYDTLIFEPLREMLTRVVEYVPTLAIGLAILVVGWIIARIARDLLVQVLTHVEFNKMADKLGLTKFLRKGGLRDKPSNVIGCVFYALTMIMVLIISVKSLGFHVASELVDSMLAYVPHVISGTVVLIIGMYLARFVSVLVYMTAKNTDMPVPAVLSRIVKWSIMAYVTILFLKEVGFASLFEGAHYTLFLAGLIFALSLAFGMAGKDVADRYLDVFRIKKPTVK